MYIKFDYQIEQMKQFAKRQCKSYLYNLKFGDFCNRFVCFLHCTFWSGITLGISCWDHHYHIIVLTTLSCLSNWLINKHTWSGMGFNFVKLWGHRCFYVFYPSAIMHNFPDFIHWHENHIA